MHNSWRKNALNLLRQKSLSMPLFPLSGDLQNCADSGGSTFKKVKAWPYSIPSVGPGDDPGVQADSPQVTVSHPPGGRLPLLSDRPAVTSSAAEHHRPLAGTKLYCMVTEAHRCEQLA